MKTCLDCGKEFEPTALSGVRMHSVGTYPHERPAMDGHVCAECMSKAKEALSDKLADLAHEPGVHPRRDWGSG